MAKPDRSAKNSLVQKYMYKTKQSISKVPYDKFVVPGAILIGLSLVPLASAISPKAASSIPLGVGYVIASQAETVAKDMIADTFFGSETSQDAKQQVIEKQMKFVSTREAYPASLSVVENNQDTIKTLALEHEVPADVAIGVALLENGGSEQAVSSAGALGVFQLMPSTARNLGLTVNKKTDERKNPEKNIDAGLKYLAKNYERFGDWGLATWAYHAGEGNVAKALKIYAEANDNIILPGIDRSDILKEYVLEHDISIHKLLSDPSVQKFTDKLNDDSANYPYKVVATATLFREANL